MNGACRLYAFISEHRVRVCVSFKTVCYAGFYDLGTLSVVIGVRANVCMDAAEL